MTLSTGADFATTAATRDRPADPLNPWTWPGRPDGIWLHVRCEAPWYDQETARDAPVPSGTGALRARLTAARAEKAIAANPEKSDRAIAAELGMHHSTVN